MQAGLIQGDFHWIGNYEQCTSVKASGKNISGLGAASHDFNGRYCRAYFHADVSTKYTVLYNDDELSLERRQYSLPYDVIYW